MQLATNTTAHAQKCIVGSEPPTKDDSSAGINQVTKTSSSRYHRDLITILALLCLLFPQKSGLHYPIYEHLAFIWPLCVIQPDRVSVYPNLGNTQTSWKTLVCKCDLHLLTAGYMPFLSSRVASSLHLLSFLSKPQVHHLSRRYVANYCLTWKRWGLITELNNALQTEGRHEKPSSKLEGGCQTGTHWKARCYWF